MTDERGSSLKLRRARPEEAAALTDLVMRSKAMWGYDDAFMEMCREELTVRAEAIAGGEVWVAEDGQGIAGVVEVVPEADHAELRLIFVEPRRAKKGVGRALWRMAEERARALGYAEIRLDADPNAAPFYERMGLGIVGQSPSGSIPGRVLPRMAKTLAG